MSDGILAAIIGFAFLSAILFFATKKGSHAHYPAAEHVDEAPRSGAGWNAAGLGLSILGGCGLLYSLAMETALETAVSSDLQAYVPSAVVNLDLLSRKEMAFTGSLFTIGIGIFCIAVGAIISAIHSRN